MNAYEKMGVIGTAARELDQFIYTEGVGYKFTLCRFVEGEPGEDPQVDESTSDLVQAPMVVDYVRERLEERGVSEDRYKVTFDTNPSKGKITPADYPRRLWQIVYDLTPSIKMGDPEVIKYCQALSDGTADVDWRKGLTGLMSNYTQCKSWKYKCGQELRPHSVAKGSHLNWYFITSYRTKSGIGAYRLLRSDGRLSSCSAVTTINEEDV